MQNLENLPPLPETLKDPPSMVPTFVIAMIATAAITVTAIVMIAIFAPEQATSLTVTVLGVTSPIQIALVGLISQQNGLKTVQVGQQLDGRLAFFVKQTQQNAFAAGRLEGVGVTEDTAAKAATNIAAIAAERLANASATMPPGVLVAGPAPTGTVEAPIIVTVLNPDPVPVTVVEAPTTTNASEEIRTGKPSDQGSSERR